MSKPTPRKEQLDWFNGIKVLALFAVLVNHLTEAFTPWNGFGSYTWLTNPTELWPPLQERLAHLWPQGTELLPSWVQALGWLGDAGPGVFILLSGFGLTYGLLVGGANIESGNNWATFVARRLSRIYPTYWVAVLVYVSVWPFMPGSTHSMEGWLGFSMLTGIRATSEVFMFWNPSWWFVWTIAQLYLAFPFLLMFAQRYGFVAMFGIALAITVASRAWGIGFSDDLYHWMTGLFAGTRLVEFAFGMWAAKLYLSRPNTVTQAKSSSWFLMSALVYVGGLASSIFLPTTVVSNLLTTIGLTGLFIFLWVGVISRLSTRLTRALLWLAPVSYAVFLIHQPALRVIETAVTNKPLALALGCLWLVACFGVSAVLVWLLGTVHRAMTTQSLVRRSTDYLLVAASIAGLLLLPLLEPYVTSWPYRPILTWLMSAFVLAALYFEVQFASGAVASAIRRWALLASCLTLWVLPPGSGAVAVLVGAGVYLGWRVTGALVTRSGYRVAVIAALIAIVAIPTSLLEQKLRGQPGRYDTDSWGELPAMTLHPTRGYGLKSNTTVELDYVYQYTVSTNESGLQGRPVSARSGDHQSFRVAVLGDAFTMPEVVEYERSYTAILERLLSACIPDQTVEVFNLGVTGYSPTEKWPQATELLPTIEPNLVIDQMFPIEMVWMQETTTERLQGIGLLPATNTDYRSFLTQQQTYQHLLRKLADLTELISRVPSTYRRSNSLTGMFSSKLLDDPATTRILAKYWSDIDHLVAQLGGRFVAVYTPAAIEVSDLSRLNYLPRYFSVSDDRAELGRPYATMRDAAETAGITLLDWREPLRLAEPASSGIYSPDFWHWTETGHAIAARSLLAMLSAQRLIPRRCADG